MPDIITRALLESKGIPTRDIVAAIWGRKLSGGYEPAEATGTLPLTFRSDGTALLDYRIYGNTVETQGVGVRTENLFDPNAAETSGNNIISDFMPLDPSELVLTMAFDIPLRASYNYEITYYDSAKTAISFVGGMGEAYKTRETVKLNRQSEAPNAAYVKVTLPKDLTNVLIQNGSTSGEHIPYGYKLPMIISRKVALTSDDLLSGAWLASNGNFADLQYYICTQKMPVESDALDVYVKTSKKTKECAANFYNGDTYLGYKIFRDYNDYEVNPSFEVLTGATEYAITVGQFKGPTLYPSDVEVFDINKIMATPSIYIGNTQLMRDEYINYASGKIYRLIDGVLTPTDPPVPLPELPTFADADTVLDYEETPPPSEVWVKYQKGD